MSANREPSAADAYKARQRHNIVGLVVIVLVLGAGAWLVDRMLTARAVQNCIEARHRNCVPLELPPRTP